MKAVYKEIIKCAGTVLVMYIVTMILLVGVAFITYFGNRDVWFAKGGIMSTYILVGFAAGICRKNCKMPQKCIPVILYMGIWYGIMQSVGGRGHKDMKQLAIITVILALSFVLGGTFHKS